MHIVSHTNAQTFCDAVLPLLVQQEAVYNLMVSIALRIADGTGKWGEEPPRLLAVVDDGRVVGAALQTPPYHLQVTEMTGEMLAALVEYLRSTGVTLPGVLGLEVSATAFAAAWSPAAVREKGFGVYQLTRVIDPPLPGGSAEEAGEADFDLLVSWERDYLAETHADRRSAEDVVRAGLATRGYWLWKDPLPVSLAACGGATPHGMRISNVYTPPAYRGRGYASANVAAMSRRVLDSGRQFCYLFTDLANPTSNHIYQQIGYEWQANYQAFGFD